MSETVKIEFTRDEWHAMLQVIRKQARTTNETDLAEEKRKIQAKLSSCHAELNRINQSEAETQTFLSIINKVERQI